MNSFNRNVLVPCFLFFFLMGCFSTPKKSEPSLEQKIGQMLMVGFRGDTLNPQSPIVKDIENYHLGGVVLFDYDVPSSTPRRNIVSAAQVQKLTASLQKHAQMPLFIAIDQEGGKVIRLKQKHGFSPAVSAQYLGSLNNPDSIRYYARKTAKMLKELGINTNLAPVVDVNTNPDNPVIGGLERSFSDDPEIVANQASIYINTLHEQGIITSLKHFPGHGSSEKDSHLGVVDVTKSWQEKELMPYHSIIQQDNADIIMTAHIFNARLDSTYPATLSKPTITGLLRDSLEFDGVVLSDDLQMKAIRSEYGLKETIRLCITAGVDVLVFANNSVFDEEITSKAYNIIKGFVEDGTISKQRIDTSYRRIMQLKKEYLIR